MIRVLRPGGTLILVDHVESTNLARPCRRSGSSTCVTVPMAGEHFRRRPYRTVTDRGLDIVRHERFKLGIVERLVARKPA